MKWVLSPGEQQPWCASCLEQSNTSQETIRIVPLADLSRTRGWMASTTQHNDGIGPRCPHHRAPLPGVFHPAPQQLRHNTGAEDPEQRHGRSHQPAATMHDGTNEQSQSGSKGKHQERQNLGEQIGHSR